MQHADTGLLLTPVALWIVWHPVTSRLSQAHVVTWLVALEEVLNPPLSTPALLLFMPSAVECCNSVSKHRQSSSVLSSSGMHILTGEQGADKKPGQVSTPGRSCTSRSASIVCADHAGLAPIASKDLRTHLEDGKQNASGGTHPADDEQDTNHLWRAGGAGIKITS
jgi:hypothetical protein